MQHADALVAPVAPDRFPRIGDTSGGIVRPVVHLQRERRSARSPAQASAQLLAPPGALPSGGLLSVSATESAGRACALDRSLLYVAPPPASVMLPAVRVLACTQPTEPRILAVIS